MISMLASEESSWITEYSCVGGEKSPFTSGQFFAHGIDSCSHLGAATKLLEFISTPM